LPVSGGSGAVRGSGGVRRVAAHRQRAGAAGAPQVVLGEDLGGLALSLLLLLRRGLAEALGRAYGRSQQQGGGQTGRDVPYTHPRAPCDVPSDVARHPLRGCAPNVFAPPVIGPAGSGEDIRSRAEL